MSVLTVKKPLRVVPAMPQRPPQANIPQTLAERERLRALVLRYVEERRESLVPPLVLDELRDQADAVVARAAVDPMYRDYVGILVSNEVWSEQLASVPFDRRLLLLPKCLRVEDKCPAPFDEFGLLCKQCGLCTIQDLQEEAERLGYAVLVAEGSALVMALIQSGKIDAIVGVSCLSVLERAFPYMEAAAIPGVAIPLLQDDCKDTAVDIDWVWNVVHLTSDDRTRRLDLDALRTEVETWFAPAALEALLGPADGEADRVARTWLAAEGKRWRPFLTACAYKALQDDPDIPLLPRAFRSSYPPGSTFKVAVGIAALESGTVHADDEFDCVPSIQIGNLTFHNWKKTNRGPLNFVQAITESCDTWFYQVGIKMGADPILDWAQKLGFGAKCGIPLRGEVEGRVPNDQYMKATHGRKLLNGDIANLSIGQGDMQVTPLQVAQAMAIIGNGGTFYQTRLVQQVQTVNNEIVTAFQVRAKKTIDASPDTMEQLRTGLIAAVNGPSGTAHQASLENVEVAGKTGTAQWGPKNKERTAAWFAGFVPAEKPQYAFAALYEGDVGSKAHGGSAAAPMIGMILKDIYKSDANKKPPRAQPVEEDESD